MVYIMPKKNNFNICREPFLSAFIDIHGNVFPCCCNHCSHISFGNIFVQSVEQVWNSPTAVEFRNKILNNNYSCCHNKMYCKEYEWQFVERTDYFTAYMQNLPKFVKFAFDQSCNNRCVFCRDFFISHQTNAHFSLDQMLELSSAADIVTFSSDGEFFFSKRYKEIYHALEKINPSFKVMLYSNGVLANAKNIQKMGLIKRLVGATISINAASKDTYKLLANKDYFDVVIRNLKNLDFLEGDLILSFVVNSQNYKEMLNFCGIAQKINAKIQFIKLLERTNYISRYDIDIDDKDFLSILHTIYSSQLYLEGKIIMVGFDTNNIRDAMRKPMSLEKEKLLQLKDNYAYFADATISDFDFEYFLQYLFHFFVNKGDNVVDVGANTALHTLPLAKIVGTSGKVFAFEAIPHYAELVKKITVNFPQVTVFEFAVTSKEIADRNPTITFNHVVDKVGYSGIQLRTDISDFTGAEQLIVTATTLDESVPSDFKISFIKLDIEGGEFDALRGAERILTHDKPLIVFEYGHNTAGKLYGYNDADFFGFFEAIDYRLFCLTGEEITKENCNDFPIFWMLFGVHKDSYFTPFFENNLFSLVNYYQKRQRNHFERVKKETPREKELLNEKVSELEAGITILRQHNADLLSSLSWRITAPLRKIYNIVFKK